MRRLLMLAALAAGAGVLGSAGEAQASSHREAPFVTKNPKVDSTDFYMFRSYETGKEANVTIIANYLPLQDAYGGPNYFSLDPEALYEIHVDNDGDGGEDITFQFRFKNALTPAGGVTVPVVLDGVTKNNNIPLLNLGGVAVDNASVGSLQVQETFTMNVVTGDRRTGTQVPVAGTFTKPLDFTGTGTFGSVANYEAYAAKQIKPFSFGTCTTGPRVFVGQRREGFAGNIGPIFDLLQAGDGKAGFLGAITTGGDVDGRGRDAGNPFNTGTLYTKNVTSIAIEVPVSCLLKAGGSKIIGAWTSASLRQARVLNPSASYDLPAKEGGAWTQVSHLGMPLVNEVVIGLKDKDLFGAVSPKSTSAVADYVTHPTLPYIVEAVFGALTPLASAPKKTRTDLVGAFATGLTVTLKDNTQLNFTQTSKGPGNPGITGNTLPTALAEYLRLNTDIAPTNKTTQVANPARGLGALGCFQDDRKVDATLPGCDLAGFPNGRRPGDDVLDIALRVVMGALFASDTDAPGRNVPFTDKNYNGPEQFDDKFPYLRTPLGGNQTPGSQP
jgi:hypothetical protein